MKLARIYEVAVLSAVALFLLRQYALAVVGMGIIAVVMAVKLLENTDEVRRDVRKRWRRGRIKMQLHLSGEDEFVFPEDR